MKKIFFIIISLLYPFSRLGAAEISFRAQVNSTTIVSGQQFAVEYIVNSDDAKELRAPDFTGFDVLSGPNTFVSINQQIVNGRISSETNKTFTYILLANKEGTYNIAPASIKVGSKQYTSNALAIKVLPPDKAAGTQSGNRTGNASQGISDEQVFIRLILSKTHVYEQEAILATFKLYTRTTQLSLGGTVSFPSFEGFVVQEIDLPQEKSFVGENYKGINYNVVTLKQSLLFPQRPGKIEIEPGKFEVIVRVRRQVSSRNFFDDFFDSYQDIRKMLTTPRMTVDVTPLPFGKPADFSGGVGTFTVTSSISSTEVKTNEAVTIKLQIKGNGNLKYIKNPEIAFPNDFDTYDPKVELNLKPTPNGVTGTKTIEYTTIPRYAGEFTIPGINFSYFDLKTKSYKTITTDSFTLHVEKGKDGEAAAPVISDFSTKENVKLLGQDIHFIKVGKMKLHKEPRFIYGSPVYILCFIIPALLFIVFVIIYRKKARENADIALRKTRKANKVASRRLKQAGKYLKANEKEQFYDEVSKAIWGYLSDKLNLPFSALTRDNIETEMEKYGAKPELIHEFMDILNTCEFARYAPVESDDAMDKLYNRTVDAIGKMENTVKK